MAIESPCRRPLSLPGVLLRGCVCGLVLALSGHFCYLLLVSNFSAVVPDLVYRSGQPSPEQLERILRKHRIRTVINLRGCCVSAPWYIDEARVASACGVSLEDLSFSASRLPSTDSLRQLVDVLDHCEYPVLFHCYQGADRTGLAAVLYCLLRTSTPYAEARRQLGLARGHVALGKTRFIDRFFELYEEWLAESGLAHSSAVFRRWARELYCPDEARAELVLLSPKPGTDNVLHVRAGGYRALRIRCWNRSLRTWQMSPWSGAGVNLAWLVTDEQDCLQDAGRVGLFRASVAPGAHIDLTIPLRPLKPGRFQLRFDLASPQQGWFLQLGNGLVVVDMEVS
jgi:protein tyrosine phosphatase (PTP) superfamily phosphohydrolase (DUF442 family)